MLAALRLSVCYHAHNDNPNMLMISINRYHLCLVCQYANIC